MFIQRDLQHVPYLAAVLLYRFEASVNITGTMAYLQYAYSRLETDDW